MESAEGEKEDKVNNKTRISNKKVFKSVTITRNNINEARDRI
jgi:hypothetical protein